MEKPRENELLQIHSRVGALRLTATKGSAADRSAIRPPASPNLLTTWEHSIFSSKTAIAWSYHSPTIKCHSIGVHRTEAGHNEAFRIITSPSASLSSIGFTYETLHTSLDPRKISPETSAFKLFLIYVKISNQEIPYSYICKEFGY
jgi:hypothetical protein